MMDAMKNFNMPIIVVAAFRRDKSLKRLLRSISNAYYPCDNIEVVISLDGGYSNEVYLAARDFEKKFTSGFVRVITRDENLGLRKHILECGDLSLDNGSCIILEDDLVVSRNFYLFACEAMKKFYSDENIAGISLYSQRYNEYANLPFEPNVDRSSDVYFMQMASSWGQLWTRNQWISFKKWYKLNAELDFSSLVCVPKAVSDWPGSSWKKYYSAYLILQNKFFVYPYQSFTSNCSDAGGTHNYEIISPVQVPINYTEKQYTDFKFINLSDAQVKYDGFMEAIIDDKVDICGIKASEISLDLYGTKPLMLLRERAFSISSKRTKENILSFPLRFKPNEANLFYPLPADEVGFFHLGKSNKFLSDNAHTKRENNFLMVKNAVYFNIENKSFLYGFVFSWLKKICLTLWGRK
ncbi:glycosyltransferase [Plesiomonas shigelloides]|nr:glycosyltransferase [Plesiomonas shigelloides]